MIIAVDHQGWRQFLGRARKVIQRLKAADPARKPRQEPRDWEPHLVVFTRRGVTPAVKAEVKKVNASVLTFADIVRDLERLPERPIR